MPPLRDHRFACPNRVRAVLFLALLITLAVAPGLAQAQKRLTPKYDAAAVMREANNDFGGTGATAKTGLFAKVGLELALLYEQNAWAIRNNVVLDEVPVNPGLHVDGGMVVVDVTTDGAPDAMVDNLRGIGMIVTGTAGYMASGRLPIASIPAIAGLAGVRAVAPSLWTTQVGATTSQGDSSMHSSYVRNAFGINGAGVTVGVLSDSYNFIGGAPADVTSGDLPGATNPNGFTTAVNVLADGSKTDEGRAMCQIVHDVAPGAALAFATANGGQATFATNINNLRTGAGCDIIVDDVFYYAEPMFQDGVIAQACDAANAAGVAYYSSAGNQARNAYGSAFRAGTVFAGGSIPVASGGPTFFGGTAHDFDPGAGTDVFQSITIPPNTSFTIVLEWDQPFASVSGAPGCQNDMDAYLLNSAATQILAGSVTANIGGDAVEVIQASNTSLTLNLNLNLMICRFTGASPGTMRVVYYSLTQNEWSTNSGTVYGHANANGAAAIGAAPYFNTPAFGVNPPTAEPFSSGGTTPILFTTGGAATFDARGHKPAITGPDGVNTTFFGRDVEPDGFRNFFGTSASAPHAAAVAALMLQAKSTATPAQMLASMEATAIDMDAAGFDTNTGAGLIQANLALQNLVPCGLTCPGNITQANDADQCGATVTFATATSSGLCGEVTMSPASGSFFAVGTTQVTATSQSGSTCTFNVTVNDTQLPVVTCPANIEVECTGNNGALATNPAIVAFLAGASASDNCPGVGTITNDAPAFFPLGETTVTFKVLDASNNEGECSAKVKVVDTRKPTITVSVVPSVLWPPNHKLVDVHATVVVSDECDPNPTFVLTSIVPTCEGAHDIKFPDIVGDTTGTPDLTYQLRADKNPDATCEHTYTITYTASDHSGNSQTGTATVVVPHDQSGHALIAGATGLDGTSNTPTLDLVITTTAILPAGDEPDDVRQGVTTQRATVTFDARTINGGDVWFGSSLKLAAPTSTSYEDADGDGFGDLVVHFSGPVFASVISTPTAADDPLILYYRPRGATGGGFEVNGLVTSASGAMATVSETNEMSSGNPSGQVDASASLPRVTQFGLARPNPSAGAVSFAFDLAFGNHARVDVYDLRGARVQTLLSGYQPAGRYVVTWDGRDRSGARAPNGVYLVRADAGNYKVTRKSILMR